MLGVSFPIPNAFRRLDPEQNARLSNQNATQLNMIHASLQRYPDNTGSSTTPCSTSTYVARIDSGFSNQAVSSGPQ